MTSKKCTDLVNDYIEWLRQKIKVEAIGEFCEITTPFLDRHNDQIQFYLKKVGNIFILTDGGYTLGDLKLSGLEIKTEKRKQILSSILNGFGAKLKGDEIIMEANPEEFPQKKHSLIQAMLAVNDLFVLSEPNVADIFREDVEKYLRIHKIRYTPYVNFVGKSGFNHLFDFVIPASEIRYERIIRVVNHPTKQNITLMIFSWNDIHESRPIKSDAYTVLNDSEQKINPELVSALQSYKIKPILWSKKEEYIKEFSE